MSKPNIKGTSYLGLDLEPDQEQGFKAVIREKEMGGKQFIRYLIRKYLESNPQKNGK